MDISKIGQLDNQLKKFSWGRVEILIVRIDVVLSVSKAFKFYWKRCYGF